MNHVSCALVRCSLAIAMLIIGTGAQARHWVPVPKHPGGDPAGMYVDDSSIKGPLTARTAWERLLNSEGVETLSLVEMNCNKGTWRVLKMTSRTPTGMILKKAYWPWASDGGKPIKADHLQQAAQAVVCKSRRTRG